jgi:hypothetical protein
LPIVQRKDNAKKSDVCVTVGLAPYRFLDLKPLCAGLRREGLGQ